MAITVAQLLVKLNADTLGAEAGFARVSKMLGPGGPLGLAVLGAGVGVAALGGIALHMAGNFQQSMMQLVTGAGESKDNLNLVSNGILKMARDTGTSTAQLAAGMFMIESAGYHGADGLAVLQAAAEGAKVGNADLSVVADAVTTVMTDYKDSHISAAQATNVLIATVANGKTHMQDLAGAVANVLPAAAAYHVQLNDVAAALATMTASGVPAAVAATYLRQTIVALGSPSSSAAKALREVGLTTDEVNAMMKKSLPDTLKMITDAVGKKFPEGSVQYNEAIKAIAGGMRQMQGMIDLTGAHMGTFQSDVRSISEQVQQGGANIQGWAEIQGDFNQQVSRAKEVVETLMIELGQKLLPVATQVFKFIADKAIPDIQHFLTWFNGTSAGATAFKVVLIALGGAIAAILVAAFVSWAIAAGAAAIATFAATWPVLAIGAAIALLIAGIILLVSHWKDITNWLGSVWKNITTAVKVDLLILSDTFTQLGVNIVRVFSSIGSFVAGIWSGIVSGLRSAINFIISGWNDLIGGLDSIQFQIPSWVPFIGGNSWGFNIGYIPQLAEGGDVTRAGMALVGERGPELVSLGAGASVTPLGAGGRGGDGRGGAGSGSPIVVQLVVDGRKLAEVVAPHMHAIVRNATGRRDF